MAMHNPAHPGRILARYIQGNELTVAQAADYLGVTRPTLSRVLHGHAAVSAEMAIRIGKTFNTDPGLWVRMQGQYDLWQASRRNVKARPLEHKVVIDAEKVPHAAHARSGGTFSDRHSHRRQQTYAAARPAAAARSSRTINS